jgi:AcrR family transcriptional regulator
MLPVGPGTLYRHFPSREELLVAVYRSEMEKLAAAERTLAESKSPAEALRAWLLLSLTPWRRSLSSPRS